VIERYIACDAFCTNQLCQGLLHCHPSLQISLFRGGREADEIRFALWIPAGLFGTQILGSIGGRGAQRRQFRGKGRKVSMRKTLTV
jgi:hypothetical protein